MRFAPEGRPFIAGAVTLAAGGWAAAWAAGGWMWAVAGALSVLAVFVPWFFRDPRREGPEDPAAVLAPADGRVVEIAEVEEPTFVGGRCRRVSIFLSIFDVHVQRAPVSGTVEHRSHRPGGYAVAWKAEASEENEQASLGLRAEGGGAVLVRQIAGLVARRIVTDPEEGDGLRRGERIGIIRFGSRVDTFLPLDWPLECRVGDTARAARSVLARMPVGPAEGPPGEERAGAGEGR